MSAPNLNAYLTTALRAHLLDMPGGATVMQLCTLTGASHKCITKSVRRSLITGDVAALLQHRSSVYFATAELLEAGMPALMAAKLADVEMYAERRRVREKEFRSPEQLACKSVKGKAKRAEARAARGWLPIGTKAAKVAIVKPPKVEKPPKVAKARKQTKGRQLSIKNKPASSGRPAGWDAAAPRITADTIVTVYTPTPWGRAAEIPTRSYGPTLAEQHEARMAAIESRRDEPLPAKRKTRRELEICAA